MKWIDVKDELPPIGAFVIVCLYNERVDIYPHLFMGVDEKGMHWSSPRRKRTSQPTHWMNYPEPPQEKK